MPSYSKAILLFLTTITFDFIFIVVFSRNFGSQGIVAIIPGKPIQELSILMGIPFLLVPIVSYLGGKMMLRFYPLLSKKLKGQGYELGLYLYEKPKSMRIIFYRTLFASFFALAIGLVVTQGIESLGAVMIPGSTVGTITALTYFLLPITALIIPPLGYLDDLGIVLYKEMASHTDLPETYSIGQYLGMIYRGFAGITTPFLFIIIIIREITLIGHAFEVLLVIFFPLFLTGYFIPMEWLMARWRDKNLDKIAKILVGLKKIGIKEIEVEISESINEE